ncbi:MAG: U32 family peptidase [Planctomycetaceae bacterium]|nr:U32 family peptidase [Planctomycetaceae bacterium]
MKKTAAALSRLGIAAEEPALPDSTKRFPDGAQFRIEIPSIETPDALSAILEEADKQKVLIHRASQGSGIMMLTDAELTKMLRVARDAKMELSLFVGPRAGFDATPQPFTAAGKVIGGSLRGGSQLVYAVEDVKRGCALGLRSVLVADLGLLWILTELKKAGELPANLVLKISILLSVPNPATAHVLESLGADTINVSPDLSLAQLSTMRGAVSAPLDIYVEVPDGFGGYIRTFEVPEMIRVASPVYVKLGLRNAPDIYPYGEQLKTVAMAMSRERVHRARLVLDAIQRYYPQALCSNAGAKGLGVPEC